jgi:hypothetical protein
MKILQKVMPLILVMAALVSSKGHPTDTTSPASPKIAYYYFVESAKAMPAAGSVVISSGAYILAPALTDLEYSPDTAADLRAALEAVLKDDRNGWTGSQLKITEVRFGETMQTWSCRESILAWAMSR